MPSEAPESSCPFRHVKIQEGDFSEKSGLHKIPNTQKLCSSTSYPPELREINFCCFNRFAGFDLVLDEECKGNGWE